MSNPYATGRPPGLGKEWMILKFFIENPDIVWAGYDCINEWLYEHYQDRYSREGIEKAVKRLTPGYLDYKITTGYRTGKMVLFRLNKDRAFVQQMVKMLEHHFVLINSQIRERKKF